ncbi:DegV family protein [Tissierella sp. Yu-01]|uniref:DegV family protein n=1 Tax=Tissierella sp. Yu-01 TaxID=3035694 RepID=UPI00240E0636|nr:DegV family protein [Tissierella sp. Yu-01]WFA07987.1 DegV family protein [Tissierella sp. Yu-01]
MSRKIILSADSTCDLSKELVDKYNIQLFPYTITLDDNVYKDNIDITPPDIFKAYREKRLLPKTSAINTVEYYNYFKEWIDKGYEIIHITLGSSLTSSFNNCCLSANELTGVHPIDSQNLSTGSGLLVIKAGELIEKGLNTEDIISQLKDHRNNIHMSFILDTLDFLYAGGRCSKLSSLGSNLLKIKPVINVDNNSGAMGVGNKYRGTIDKVLIKYIKDKLSSYNNINKEHVCLVHSGVDDELIDIAKNAILEHTPFKTVHTTVASCTITCHCGPNTIGFSFETI